MTTKVLKNFSKDNDMGMVMVEHDQSELGQRLVV